MSKTGTIAWHQERLNAAYDDLRHETQRRKTAEESLKAIMGDITMTPSVPLDVKSLDAPDAVRMVIKELERRGSEILSLRKERENLTAECGDLESELIETKATAFDMIAKLTEADDD